MVILVKQSTSKYDSMGDSIWLTRQGKCASSTGIVWFEWFFSKGKGILKIELQKYMAKMKILERSSSEVYAWYTKL